MGSLIVLCSVPSHELADHLAHTLVDERLAACVNRLAGIMSTYRWRGQIELANEALLMIKTTHERFDALRERIITLHPYELPELIAIDVATGHAPYLDWIAHETS